MTFENHPALQNRPAVEDVGTFLKENLMSKWVVRLSVLLAMIVSMTARAQSNSAKPNIVVILADDLGYADIGAQGQLPDVRTPNVDSIAKAGVRFTNAYVSCPICSPSRAGFITGRYQTHFGHEFNPGPNESPNFGLPLDQITLPQVLKEAGYTTGMVGKWHLGFRPEMRPQKRGFDEFFGFLAGAHSYNDVGKGRQAVMEGDTAVESSDYLTTEFGKRAADFVERHANDDKPFFLYLAFNAVHDPQQAPEKYLEKFKDVKDQNRQMLLAKLACMDDEVGRVLGALRKHNIEDNTLIVFFSDNGGPTRGNGSRNDPLRGVKGQVLEGGIRIPFMIQWNHHIPAGKVDDRPIISLDIFPTALEVAGAKPPKDVALDGVDLLPFLTGEQEGAPHQSLFWRIGPQWAVRDGNLKLVHRPAEGGIRLYDLSKDIKEEHDLSESNPDDVKRLQKEYDEWNAKNEKPRWYDTRDVKHARQQKHEGASSQPADQE
jgi:arylsulfatase A-like enzyme